MQGWCYLKSGRGRYDHVYGMIKQRSFFYNATAVIDRSDPGVQQVFLEGATAAVVRNNPATGEFEFAVMLPDEERLELRVDSEAQEATWVQWFNTAGQEEVWRATLTQWVKSLRPEEEVKEEVKEEVDSYYKSSKLGALMESDKWEDYSSNELVMIEYMSRLIDTYLSTVKKNLIDSIPKVCARMESDM